MTGKRPSDAAPDLTDSPKRRCHGHSLSFPFGTETPLDIERTPPARRGAIDLGLGLGHLDLGRGSASSPPSFADLPSSSASSVSSLADPFAPPTSFTSSRPHFTTSLTSFEASFAPPFPSPFSSSFAPSFTSFTPSTPPHAKDASAPPDMPTGSPRWPTIPLPPCEEAASPAEPGAPPPWPLPPLPLSFNMSALVIDDDALTTASMDSAAEDAVWEAASLLLVTRARRRAMSAPLRPGIVWEVRERGRAVGAGGEE